MLQHSLSLSLFVLRISLRLNVTYVGYQKLFQHNILYYFVTCGTELSKKNIYIIYPFYFYQISRVYIMNKYQ